jgi:hypothetical protein
MVVVLLRDWGPEGYEVCGVMNVRDGWTSEQYVDSWNENHAGSLRVHNAEFFTPE